jgi:aspartyl protease family protein
MHRVSGALLLICSGACAQSVSMSGSLGDKALLIIDGTPRTVATGSTVQGVRLISVHGSDAVVEIGGKRMTLAMGGAQVSIGGSGRGAGSGTTIVLPAGSGGHFFATGTINGKAAQFVVDTGATYVSMGVSEAERLGIDYRGGQRGTANTANGPMTAYRVKLATIRIGDVQLYDVDALIGQAPMEFVLLGNSFLSRFEMKRENDTMTLSKRY